MDQIYVYLIIAACCFIFGWDAGKAHTRRLIEKEEQRKFDREMNRKD